VLLFLLAVQYDDGIVEITNADLVDGESLLIRSTLHIREFSGVYRYCHLLKAPTILYSSEKVSPSTGVIPRVLSPKSLYAFGSSL